ncbi:MAG: heavy-metal-associated domain-containing protein [Bowdeniella nasicola]|nr:heavy-metal-associated domain-containing protein [Bowdeniella nasicola]
MSAATSQNNLTHTVLRAEGFSCPSCVATIEKRLARVNGVQNVTVHFASARIEIDHDIDVVGVDALVAEVKKAGFAAKPAAF